MLRHVVAATGLLLIAPVAQAQTIVTPPVEHVSGDVVVLKDGSVLHGTVREMTPGQALTIVLADGQSRTIDWTAIERVDIDRAKTAAPAVQAPPQATTVVHVEGAGSDVLLQALDEHGTASAWTTVCRGACDRALSTAGLYRIDAPGIRASKAFRIDASSTTLQVHTASSAGFAGGLAMLIGGGLLFVNGLSLVIVAAIDQDIISKSTFDTFMEVGGVLAGVGAVSLVAGLFVLRGNMHTTVAGATTLRVPAWRDAPAHQPSRFGAITFPALTGAF